MAACLVSTDGGAGMQKLSCGHACFWCRGFLTPADRWQQALMCSAAWCVWQPPGHLACYEPELDMAATQDASGCIAAHQAAHWVSQGPVPHQRCSSQCRQRTHP